MVEHDEHVGMPAWSLFHTQSEANVSGLIVSDPEVGTKSYGLTPHGRHQVVQVLNYCRPTAAIQKKIYCRDILYYYARFS